METMLSIILPAWNEEKAILKIKFYLGSLKIPFQSEIIFVAGGEDNTFNVCKQLSFDNFNDVLVLKQEHGDFKSGALIKGIKKAKGKFIILIDADVYVASNLAIEIVKSLKKYDVVACDFIPMMAKGFWYNYYTVFKLIWSKNPFKLSSLIGGATISLRKDVIKEIGVKNLFTKKSTAGVDYYMSLTLKKYNKRIGFVKSTRVLMPRPNNLRDFSKDYNRWLTAYYSIHQKEKSVFIINFILSFTYCIFPPLILLMNISKLNNLDLHCNLKIKYSLILYFVDFLKNFQNLFVIIKKLINRLQPIGHFKGQDRYLT